MKALKVLLVLGVLGGAMYGAKAGIDYMSAQETARQNHNIGSH